MAAKTVKIDYSAAKLAAELNTDPRTLRKFLRSDASGVAPVGKGGRYVLSFTPSGVQAIAKKFDKWTNDAAARKAEAEKKAARVQETITELEDAEPLVEADNEPTEAELDELEDFEV